MQEKNKYILLLGSKPNSDTPKIEVSYVYYEKKILDNIKHILKATGIKIWNFAVIKVNT